MNKVQHTTTIALLAGLLLASSCNVLCPKRGEVRAGDMKTNQVVIDTIDLPVVQPVTAIGNEQQYAPRTLIIFYDPEVGTTYLDQAIEAYGAEVIYRYHNFNGVAIVIPEGKDFDNAISTFELVKGVLAVNRDRIYHLMD